MSDTRGLKPLLPEWGDKPDEWTESIHAAHPTRSGSHDEYGVAMQMVGNRHSKAALVLLVNWLLVRLHTPVASPVVSPSVVVPCLCDVDAHNPECQVHGLKK